MQPLYSMWCHGYSLTITIHVLLLTCIIICPLTSTYLYKCIVIDDYNCYLDVVQQCSRQVHNCLQLQGLLLLSPQLAMLVHQIAPHYSLFAASRKALLINMLCNSRDCLDESFPDVHSQFEDLYQWPSNYRQLMSFLSEGQKDRLLLSGRDDVW